MENPLYGESVRQDPFLEDTRNFAMFQHQQNFMKVDGPDDQFYDLVWVLLEL